MPTSVGPNTKGEENLVFSYDLGDVSNSFKGEPAFNAASSLSDWNTYRSTLTSTTEIKPPVKGATVYVLERTDTNSGVLVRDASPTYGGGGNNDLVGLGDGNWKYSIWVKGHSQGDSSTSFQIDIGDRNSNGLSITPTTPWTRVTTTDAAGLNSSNYEFCDFSIGGALNNKIYVSAVMISSGSQSHPQWLPSKATRSATQGLIDLTGNSTIDLTNVSFDSNAQMTFDGTDDILYTGLYDNRDPSTDPFTVEAWVKSDVTSANKIWVDATGNGTNQRFYAALIDSTSPSIGIQGSAWSDTVPAHTNWTHQVIVMDGSRAKAYADGEFKFEKSYTSYNLFGDINVGGRSGYRWVGKISMFKIYERALTASEIKANYNATKGRFNI
jgi:hypothetical protein